MSNGDKLNVLAGTWSLQTTSKAYQSAEIMLTTAGEASLIGDHRNLVAAKDFKDGGKYRSIVKLQIQFENDDTAWAMASGWLIQEDIVVTAGHCAYDWSNQLGRAVRVKAYIGYNGKESIAAGGTADFRKGIQITTTSGWLSAQGNRESDVSFILLEKKFTGNLNMVNYAATPITGLETLGVVGYPADKKNGDEAGAQMYEEWDSTSYDLAKSWKHMLEYEISTYAGNSGSPVLRSKQSGDTSFTSIATHAYGGLKKNSGSSIAGEYGNPYEPYVDLLNNPSKYPVLKTAGNINYISVPNTSQQEFSFDDVFKVVSTFGIPAASAALSNAAPFLGPIAGPVAALASAVLGFAGTLAETNMGAEVSVADVTDYTGFIQRGIIAEASIQTILDLSVGTYKSLGLEGHLKDAYKLLGPNVYGLGPRLLPVMIQPAASVGYDSFVVMKQKYDRLKAGEESADDTSRKLLNHPDVTEGSMDPDTEDFIDHMWVDTVEVAGENWFFDQLGQVIYDATINGRTPTKVAPAGICFLSSLVGAKGPIEASQQHSNVDLHNLCCRAVFGEMALQALIHCDHAKLQQEGGFDTVKKHAQDFGRQAMQLAEWVIPRLTPILIQLLKDAELDPDSQGGDSPAAVGAGTAGLHYRAENAVPTMGQMATRAAHSIQGFPAESVGQDTVRAKLLQDLEQMVNLDGLAFTSI